MTSTSNVLDPTNDPVRTTNHQNSHQEIEYYPRLKRPPYLYDASDFRIRPTTATSAVAERRESLPNYDESATAFSPSRARRGSLARVFSSLGMGPNFGDDVGTSMGDTDTTMMVLTARSRRGTSTGGVGMPTKKYPRWVLYDPSSIVMKDGVPISVGTLLHHQLLLNRSQVHCIVNPTWRLKERMKTVGVCLILALNIGTDPPDLNKPNPCAKLQCWLDPTSISRAKAKERIGERLEQQYSKWQQRSKLKYRRAIDPTIDVVKDLCIRMRESAKGERVLLHYNGHGVPRPTANGEIWLFDKYHTNYIPLSVADLRRWIGKPSIVVLDCSGAGQVMPFFAMANDDQPVATRRGSSADAEGPMADYLTAIRDTIVLSPTGRNEWLPLDPEFPADIFTSCLTTPIPIALRWFVHRNPLSTGGIDIETIADIIPGKLTDRKTPLGELNWIFTAVTDAIAWNVLPSPLFQRLFRQDLLVASMFRNFLLAERILRGLNRSPMSYPELPSTCHHLLWQAWDLAVETCLHQLIDQGLLTKSAAPLSDDEGTKDGNATDSPPATFTTDAPFFAEQLTAFEIWLEYANTKSKSKLFIRSPPSATGGTVLPYLHNLDGEGARLSPYELDPPQELPIVLQVLLSQAHRIRALVLLKRFLDLGPSAVNLALSVGIFPYVLKLLQSPVDEYKHVLIGIWARIIAFDESCQMDVVKDRALPHFIKHLNWSTTDTARKSPSPPPDVSLEEASEQRIMAAFILSVICSGYTLGQSECINEKLHLTCGTLLQSIENQNINPNNETANVESPPLLRMWICICIGNLAKDNSAAQSEMYVSGLHLRLLSRLDDPSADVRTAACYALGCLMGSAPGKATFGDAIQPLASSAEPQLVAHAPQQFTPSNLSPLSVSFNPAATSQFNPYHTTLSQQSYGLETVSISSNSAPTKVSYVPARQERTLMFGAHVSMPPDSTTQTFPQSDFRTVFDENRRMDVELLVSVRLAKSLNNDASSVVRFESALALNLFVAKYIIAVVSVVGESIVGTSLRTMNEDNDSTTLPQEESFLVVWTRILKLHRTDPQPSVRSLLGSIVIAVNARVMSDKSNVLQPRTTLRRQSMFSSSTEEADNLQLRDDGVFSQKSFSERRIATGIDLSSYFHASQQTLAWSEPLAPNNDIGTPPKGLLSSGDLSTPIKGPPRALSFDVTPESDIPCPDSMFYFWKKVEFSERGMEGDDRTSLDPLSDIGAIKSFRFARNYSVQQKGQFLKDSFAIIAQKPPSNTLNSPYSDWETRASNDSATVYEKDIDTKKKAIHLKQTSLLRNSSARGTTSLLRFHPYEPALVVCGGTDNISCWNFEASERMTSFSNDNPKNTRMTAASWINETSTSLLLTGSSDGSVRIWDGVFEPNDEMSRENPTLVSSFFAVADITLDKASSGLVLEYQDYSGRLIAGGNTHKIRCWDLASETCHNSFETGSEASVTAITSAWSRTKDGYSGLGPDLVMAGYSNGSLRIYDTRSSMKSPGIDLTEWRHRNRLVKYFEYDEHSSWIVDMYFTTYGGRYEVVSGCVGGSIKFWDLRYSSSIRTLDHKMQMTALTVHSNIPMFATGSPAQFIKLVCHDGLTQQVIRYHEKTPGQRIGPVSCLSFHPHLPYLAAGFSDDYVSLFAPKNSML